MANFQREPKAFDIIRGACAVQGIPQPMSSVVGSDDVTFQQMVETLSSLGVELVTDWMWPQLIRAVDIAVPASAPGATSVLVDAPADFDRWVDDTQWATGSGSGIMSGPTWEQGWQYFTQAVAAGSVFNIMWRQAGPTQMELKPVNAGRNMALRYISRGWVRDDSDASVLRDHIEKDSDHCNFDFQMIKLGLIYKWRERKGFDTTSEKRDYEYRRDTLLGQTKGAMALSLTRRNASSPLISVGNVPDTGFGR